MNALGIHDGHNAAAALIRDGAVVAAVQEERLSRVKNHDVFPTRAIERVLARAGCAPADLDVVAMNGAHQPRHRDSTQLMAAIRRAGGDALGARLKRAARNSPIHTLFRGLRRQERLKDVAACGLDTGRVAFIDHHTAHAAAAYWGSPFRDGPVVVLTCDGAGDELCATVSVADAGRLERRFEVAEEHSIGMVYLTVTQLLGMVPNEHEYKVMGLAPYARGEGVERCLDGFRSLIEFAGGGTPVWRRRKGVPHAFALYGYLCERLEGFRFDHIAGALQRWIEEALCEWVRRAVAATGIRRLALSGGVFMNVKVNKAIAELPEVDDLFVFPSCGDESNAIGAAIEACAQRGAPPKAMLTPDDNVYWGAEFGAEAITTAVAAHGAGLTIERLADPAGRIASLLAQGEIVARFAGRAEFGARALGNRSLLADPARPGVVRQLNDAIKNRDFWMPFAATVRQGRASNYLVNPKALAAPHMMLAFDTTARRDDIAAAIHPYDYTIRPQILAPDANPAYDALLAAFESRTGRGALLNTSLNMHGQPMVYSPEDALDVFRRSALRWLALGELLIGK